MQLNSKSSRYFLTEATIDGLLVAAARNLSSS
jgi:hypothetical protein